MVWKRQLNNDMTYTINTSVRNVAENGTEEERTFYIVTGTQDGEATIIGQYDTQEAAEAVKAELEALDNE